MNQIMGSNQGFPVSAHTDPKTKGVWMRCATHPKQVRHTIENASQNNNTMMGEDTNHYDIYFEYYVSYQR